MSRGQNEKTVGRFDYVPFTEAARQLNDIITSDAVSLEARLEALPNSREKALALTSLEQTVMWARKALREVK